MPKDLREAMKAECSVEAHPPMGARAAEFYEAFAAIGNGSLDFPAIIKAL